MAKRDLRSRKFLNWVKTFEAQRVEEIYDTLGILVSQKNLKKKEITKNNNKK